MDDNGHHETEIAGSYYADNYGAHNQFAEDQNSDQGQQGKYRIKIRNADVLDGFGLQIFFRDFRVLPFIKKSGNRDEDEHDYDNGNQHNRDLCLHKPF